jgi:hypothetical protein
MTKKHTDSEIISNVIEALDINANKLSNKLGFKSPGSIYRIIRGQNSITLNTAQKLIEAYPSVNFLYLTKGELPILLNKDQYVGQNNLLHEGKASEDIHQRLNNIERLLYKIMDRLGEV